MTRKVLVLDTETGGLDAATSSILTLGAAVWNDGGVDDRIVIPICEPEIVAAPEALAVNGCDVEELKKNGMSPATAVAALNNFILKNNMGKRPVIAGHNLIGFDVPFLERLWRLAGLKFRGTFDYHTIDTMVVANFLRMTDILNVPDAKLRTLCRYFDIEVDQADGVHRADDDAVATAHLLTKLSGVVRGKMLAPPAPLSMAGTGRTDTTQPNGAAA